MGRFDFDLHKKKNSPCTPKNELFPVSNRKISAYLLSLKTRLLIRLLIGFNGLGHVVIKSDFNRAFSSSANYGIF
jgi:hypothetical protein